MPTKTFFQLPRKKRRIVINACLDEFAQFSYVDASINRIIKRAKIPRGSFYQYFLDKKDVFFYLLREPACRFQGYIMRVLYAENERITETALDVFYEFTHIHTVLTKAELQYMRILQLNSWLDWQQWLLNDKAIYLTAEAGFAKVDAARLSASSLMLFLCKQYILNPQMEIEEISTSWQLRGNKMLLVGLRS